MMRFDAILIINKLFLKLIVLKDQYVCIATMDLEYVLGANLKNPTNVILFPRMRENDGLLHALI